MLVANEIKTTAPTCSIPDVTECGPMRLQSVDQGIVECGPMGLQSVDQRDYRMWIIAPTCGIPDV